MMYAVELSEQAELDLRGIFEYIAYELLSVQSAAGQLDRLEARISALDHHPKRYSLYDREPWRSRGLRTVPEDHYRVFYLTDDERAVVTVIRVMYAGRNADQQLNRYPVE